MRFKIVIGISLATIIVGAVVFGQAAFEGRDLDRSSFDRDQLKVLSYSTFVSSFGPGPELARRFEKRTGVKVELVNIGDSGLIVQKMMEDPSIYADVILGLDRLQKAEAEKVLGWKKLPPAFLPLIRAEIASSGNAGFVPVMWSPLTFLYQDVLFEPIFRLDQLLTVDDLVFSLQDPRLSTPGLQFLYWWTKSGKPKDGLNSKKIRVSPSWSQSYGLFKRKTADIVFTYLTSIVFHWEQDKGNYDYFEATDGHPWQVEFAGIPERCRRCDDAQKFIRFLLQPESQTLIMQKNYMLPAVNGIEKTGLFKKLPDLPLLDYSDLDQFLENRENLEKEFFETFQ